MDSKRAATSRSYRGLVMLLVAFTTLALVYSIVVPIFEGPDEDDHFRYVKYLADHRDLPVQLFQSGGGSAGHQGWQPPLYYGIAALVISPVDTSDFEKHLWLNPAASFQGDRACCGRNLYFHTPSEDFPYTGTTLAVHLARGVSILFGALTVALIYLLVLSLLPNAPGLALAAASIAAFNPSFIFASMLVSNDAPLAAFCTLALLLGVRLLTGRQAPTLRNFSFLGLAIALGLLVKTTALGLIPFALVVGAFLAWRVRQVRILGATLIGVLVPVVLLTGWWFIRNQLVYGDPLAYRLMYASAIFPRDQPLTLAELFQINLPWLWQTFWGGPTPGDFPPVLLLLLSLLTLLAGVGAVWWFLTHHDLNIRIALLWLVGWLGFIFVAQVAFIRTSGGTDQGRYLFPALGVFAFLFVLGMEEVLARVVQYLRRWRTHPQKGDHTTGSALTTGGAGAGGLSIKSLVGRLGTTAAIVVAAGLAVYVLLANTLPAYARPWPLDGNIVQEAQSPANANFSNQLALRGYSISHRNVRPGDTIDVTLYWIGIKPMRESYRVFVHLVDTQGHVAGGKDVIPGGGAYATVLWLPGEWVKDTVSFAVTHDAVPGDYQLEIGIYPFGQPENRVNLINSDEDRVLLDKIVVQQ
ncbi:MAG: phospholipid carrier-dependent glycosyltransferase [Anaerolineae bacterium]